MRHILFALCLFILPSTTQALGPDPHREWHSADSPHFRVNYAGPQRAQAERVADIAERVHARLTQQFQWEPSDRIEIVVLDEFDFANGFSTPYPFNETALFLTPPDGGELLDNSVWLELLITHELTHTIHLDKARGVPRVMRQIFGRHLPLFPNLWQPGWAIEGIATYNESTPEIGQGRLRGPMFEAWMQIEHERGFRSLSEMNADGRALPTSKQYLYGVYFYDFLVRKYGPEAIYKYINRYSGNFPLVARVHTNPVSATGKTMDVLWDEFIADLGEQMNKRKAALKSMPLATGDIILPANFEIGSLAPAPDGGVLAVVNDGLLHPALLHVDARGDIRHLVDVRAGSRIDVRNDGKVLLAQLEVCSNHRLYYDLYTWDHAAGMQRKTECGRYRRAVWLGEQVAALRTEGGITTLSLLDASGDDWKETKKLYQTPDLVEAVDLAASPDGKRIALSIKRAGAWQVLEFDRAGGAPRVLLNHDAPIHSLRYARDGNGLEFIAATGGIYNLWRYSSGTQELARLSHTDTAVMSHSGVAQDGSVVLAVLADGGTELRRMQTTTALARSRADTRQSAPLEAAAPPATRQLGEASGYHALKSLYPRAWMPAALADRGLTAYGVSVFGSDALLWHHYSANLLWETSQHEAIGSFSYNYLDAVFLDFSRNLQTREWTGSGSDETVTRYDRTTDAQISSLLPLLASVDRRLFVGIGAAMQTTDQVQVGGATTRAEEERVGAAFLRYDSRDSNWYADGINRGNLSTLLYESYRPFDSYYDGHVARFDTRGYLPLGKTVLSARWTEARAYGITEPFYLGGAFEPELTQVPMLNQRDLPLRGYRNGALELRGQNASTASIEWRTPIADIDRHAMTPPVGINRLSAAVFVDAGRAWDNDAVKPKYYRGVGVELLGEIRLIYLATIPVRLGIARGMDHPGEVQGYLRLGLPF